MSKVFNLDSMREELDREFAPAKAALRDGTEVVLRNALRLGEKDRKSLLDNLGVLEGLKDLDGKSEDEVSPLDLETLAKTLSNVLAILAGKHGRQLVKELDGDIQLMYALLEGWMEESQAGEASDSQD